MFGNRSIRSKFDLGLVVLLALLRFSPLTARAGFLYLLNDVEAGNRIYGFNLQ